MANPARVERKFVIPEPSGQISMSALTSPKEISFLGTSYWGVKEAMIKVFGEFPITLNESHIQVLEGMCAAAGEGSTPYEEILSALKQHGGLCLKNEPTKQLQS